MFFDPGMIATHRATYAQEPWEIGSIRWIASTRTPFEGGRARHGRGRAFCAQAQPRCMVISNSGALENGRPPANIRTVIGADISHGAGPASPASRSMTQSPARRSRNSSMRSWARQNWPTTRPCWAGGLAATTALVRPLMVPRTTARAGRSSSGCSGWATRTSTATCTQERRQPHPPRRLGGPPTGGEGNQVGPVRAGDDGGRIQNRSMYAIDQCTQYVYLKSGSVGCGSMESADGAAERSTATS